MTTDGSTSRTPSTLESSAARRLAAQGASESDPARDDSELAFVHRLIERDGDAWNELATKYRPAILRGVTRGFAELSVTMTPGGLEEICAEMVFVLFQRECAALRSFQGRSTFATWLTVVSRRVCLAKLLNQERLVPGGSRASTDVDLNTLPARGSSTELAEELQCELQAMHACLPRLSPPDQFIIQCFFFEGLTYQQIADQLRITKNAVGPKLTRARSRLRRLVALHQQRSSASPTTPSDPGNPKHGS